MGDLISTGDVRTWMSIPSGDTSPNAKIDELIWAVESFCDDYTGRKLYAQAYTSDPQECHFDGTGKYWIYTKQYPINNITGIYIDGDRQFGSGTLLASADYYFYPSGKICSESGIFIKGRRNVRIDYHAGYAPVAGGTCDTAVGTYPLPYDLRQVMIEMVVKSFKEGITMIHTVETEQASTFIQLLSQNSFWRKTLNHHKKFSVGLGAYEE